MENRDDKGRFVPGHTGGPGRPKKGEALTDVLREKIDKEAIADKLIEMVGAGDLAAIKYVYDRLDGRPVETVNKNVMQLPPVIEVETFEDTPDSEDTTALPE